jgi:uncharacterized membrane protein YqaE (UPF0057 family)
MKRIIFVVSILTGIFLSSCATSNVASNSLIQKRKHNKGFHLNFPSKVSDRSDESLAKELKHNGDFQNTVIEYNPITANSSVSSAYVDASINDEKTILASSEEKVIEERTDKRKVNKGNRSIKSVVSNVVTRNVIPEEKEDLSKDQLTSKSEESSNSLFRVELILLVILCFLLPPLAVFLSEGSWNTRCWISLILTLLFWVPGIIYALYVVLV